MPTISRRRYRNIEELRRDLELEGRLVQCPIFVKRKPRRGISGLCKIPGDTLRGGFCHLHDPDGEHQKARKGRLSAQ